MTAKTHPVADDLEALFDRIAAERDAMAPAPAQPVAPPAVVNASATDDLEALFDQVAAERASSLARAPAVPATPAPAPTGSAPDNDELEALFDTVAAARLEAPAGAPAPIDEPPAEHLFHRLGQLTRTLHDALRELGYDKKIASAASSLPDARDRLAYIANLTGQAAERVLAAVEAGQQVQDALQADGRALSARWAKLYGNELSVEEFKSLAGDTRAFLEGLPAHAGAMQAQLHAIMMAQDFHDLTGQVIKKVVDVAGTLESSLVALLVETQQVERKGDTEWLSGPAIGDGNPDVVKNQAQVDSLLESLGF